MPTSNVVPVLVDHTWIEGIGEKLLYPKKQKNDDETDYLLSFWDGNSSRANFAGCTPRASFERAVFLHDSAVWTAWWSNSSAKTKNKNRIPPQKINNISPEEGPFKRGKFTFMFFVLHLFCCQVNHTVEVWGVEEWAWLNHSWKWQLMAFVTGIPALASGQAVGWQPFL